MADGDQTASRRRVQRTGGGYDQKSSLYRDMSHPGTSPRTTTDSYPLDEGMFDIRRPSSSVVRMSQTTGNVPRQTGTQPSPVPQRRKGGTGTTREMPAPQARQPQTRQPQSRQTQQTQQTRSPRYSTGSVPTPYAAPSSITRGSKLPTRPAPTPVRTKEKSAHRVHWLLPAGVGMIVMLLLWIIGSNVLAWGTQRYNDVVYGTPRTYRTFAVVGHGGDSKASPSYFMAINLNNQAVIIELEAGDPSKSISYKASFIGNDSDKLDPITLEFKDINGDGKPDMIVHVHRANQDSVIFFINDGKEFRGQRPDDKVNYSN